MKRFRKALGIVALALVVSLSLAMPVSAWADEAESYGKPDVSGPQSAWYNGQSHHFRSTVKDSVSGKDLVEGEDYTRSFGFLRDRGDSKDVNTYLASNRRQHGELGSRLGKDRLYQRLREVRLLRCAT